MVEEQVRYLRLIIFYAPIPPVRNTRPGPEPVARYSAWAQGANQGQVGCVHIRHAGRIRFGKKGRWMNMKGEAFFSLATPGFVWHTTIAYAPGIWLESLDYYVHHDAGMNLNLYSLVPLNNSHEEKIKTSSLFRYLACMPLFPMITGTSHFINWENVDDSTAKAIIRDNDLSVEAVARFRGRGGITSIDANQNIHPETGRPVPGHFSCRYAGYADRGGVRIPLQVSSDMILPDGECACAEYAITEIEFDTPVMEKERGSR
ncbi:DUF6920 family protein [uncultured Methanoregula sp.]|uniref:DUF6920 family protein n=1 Tax=uncultured Methanoregula sp. TaxID=1005933 RepID=UPI002AAA6F91|nr:DUF6544 family protein [uncultured Methanoregula sp.]